MDNTYFAAFSLLPIPDSSFGEAYILALSEDLTVLRLQHGYHLNLLGMDGLSFS